MSTVRTISTITDLDDTAGGTPNDGDVFTYVAAANAWEPRPPSAPPPTFPDQHANVVFAGPSTGADAQPAFRALVAADIPALPYQPVDAELTAIAGLVSAADTSILFTGSGSAALYTLTAAGRALLDDASASDQRATLGLGTAATQNTSAFDPAGAAAAAQAASQPLDATLTNFAALTISANSLTVGTGADAFNQVAFAANTFPARASTGNLVAKTLTDFALSILDDPDGSTVCATIGAGTTAGTLAQFAATTSAQLAGVISDETGTGLLVFATSPTLTTPNIGVATATTVNKVTITAPATGSTLTIDDGATLHCTGTVAALSGSHTGTSSGTNTGDQTITLTGDVTGSGTGSFAATIAALAVTTGKIAANAVTSAKVDSTVIVAAGTNAFTGDQSMGTHKITSLGDPASAQDAATKAYVDAATTGLDVKASCRAATTANITLSGTQTIDGVACIAGDRVLVKNQSTASQNGLYSVASSSWPRTTDADANAEVTSGLFTFVSEGTVNAGTGWVLTTADPITVGSTSLSFSQFSGPGTYTAGAGLTLTGTQFSVSTGGVTNAMLAGSITFSKLVGSDITAVGTLTGLTVSGATSLTGGAFTITGNAASSLTTSSGALTVTSAAAATWSAAAGTLTVNGTGGLILQGGAATGLSFDASGRVNSNIVIEAAAHTVTVTKSANDVVGSAFSITGATAGDASSAAGKAGGALTFTGGTGAAGAAGQNPGAGGAVTLQGGNAGASNGQVSSSAIRGGNANVTAGNGILGAGSTRGTPGGSANITGGDGGNASPSGSGIAGFGGGIVQFGGNGGSASTGSGAAGAGGVLQYASGNGGAATTTGAAGVGGDLLFAAGTGGLGAASTNGPAAGGNLTFTAGAAGAITGGFSGANGGNMTFDAGAKSGTGTDGTITIGGTTCSAMTIGKSALPVTMTGTFTFGSTIAGSVSGSAATLTTARKINQVSFDGSADINVNTAAVRETTNLKIANNTGTPNTKIDFAPANTNVDAAWQVVLEDSSNNIWRARSTSTLTMDTAGTGANGLDAGSQAASTWYYLFIIAKNDGTIASLASTSSTAPTMPSGYTYKALVGAVRSDGSTHFIAFTQVNKRVWCAKQNILAGTVTTGGTWQNVAATTVLPPIATTASGNFGVNDSTVGSGFVAVAGDANGTGMQMLDIPVVGTKFFSFGSACPFNGVPLMTAQTIYYTGAVNGSLIRVDITGWDY